MKSGASAIQQKRCNDTRLSGEEFGMGRSTIMDVADRAGASIKTVSRVINGLPHVRPAMRARIEAAIEALDFVPNSAARSLAGTRSYVIGAFFDNPSPSYVVALQRGAMTACREAGFHLVIEEVDSSAPDLADRMRTMLANARLDGVILSPPLTDNPVILDALETKGLRYVRLAPVSFPGRSSSVTIDDHAATVEIAQYLWSLGHRSFAVVTGPQSHGCSAPRLAGFLESIGASGGDPQRVRLAPGDFSFRSGMEAGHVLLSAPDRPTAIFACNDDMAAGVLAAAAKLELQVPRDVSVVGYDDSAIAQQVWPPLSTIRQPIARMAAESARLLIEPAENGRACEVPIAFEMIVRGSAGRVAGADRKGAAK